MPSTVSENVSQSGSLEVQHDEANIVNGSSYVGRQWWLNVALAQERIAVNEVVPTAFHESK